MHSKDLSKQSSWAVEVLSVILSVKINGGHGDGRAGCCVEAVLCVVPQPLKAESPRMVGGQSMGGEGGKDVNTTAAEEPCSHGFLLPGLACQWTESAVTQEVRLAGDWIIPLPQKPLPAYIVTCQTLPGEPCH